MTKEDELEERRGKKYFYQYDELTQLRNQSSFFLDVRKLLDQDKVNKYVFVRFDVDRFRMINSFYGVEEGNRLLVFIGYLINKVYGNRDNCICGRIYADVFVLCVPVELGNELFLTKNIIDELNRYKKPYYIKLSVGIYEIEDKEIDVTQMYDNATMAAASCKSAFNQTFGYFKVEMAEQVKQEHLITNHMREALTNHEFQVYYQPKYDIEGNRPYGAEALVRWVTKNGDIIPPNSFIPTFEKNGFIIELDYYVWEEVCIYIKEQIQIGKEVLPVSVNVSRLNLYDPDFIVKIKGLVEKYQVPLELFQLEITESVFMDSEQVVFATIQELHRSGFTIMMDDFGSGYSSLNILKDMSLDVLKVDMRFLTNTNIRRGEIILESVVEMAKKLKLQVIVEGVEEETQLNLIRKMGVNYFQGYFYARPMPQSKYVEFIKNSDKNKIFKILKENIVNIHEDYYQSFFTATLTGLPYGVLLLNRYNEIFQFNQKLSEMLGCGNSLLQVKNFLENNHFIEMLYDTVDKKKENRISFVADVFGETKYFVVSSVDINDLGGNHWGSACYFLDESIGKMFGTENYYMKMFLSFVQLYHHVFELDYMKDEIREVYCDTEQKHHKFEVDAKFTSMDHGLQEIAKWIHPGDRGKFHEFISENNIEDSFLIRKKKSIECELRIKKENGTYTWSNLSVHIIHLSSHNITYMCCFRDITEIKEAEKDFLSGLLTRGTYVKAIESLLASRNSVKNHAFIMMDVDYYKHINDTYGHQVGDEVIQLIGDTIKKEFEISSVCGRIGGDEFVVFSRNPVDRCYLRSRIEKMQNELIEKTYGELLNEELTLSIGCYYVERDQSSFDEMYEHADKLLYEAKKERNTMIEGTEYINQN